MRKLIAAFAIAILLISWLPTIILATPPSDRVLDFAPDRILVKFKPGVTLLEAAEVHRQLGGQLKATIPGIDVQVVTVPKGQAMAKVKAYSANSRVAYAEPDFLAATLGTPNDPSFSLQWGLTKVQAPEAWDVTIGSPSITIAILDTGVDLDHPDLAGKLVAIKNFTSSPTADDLRGHGTHVAGIAAALTNNGIGVAGLGYSATLMNVKVLGDDGFGFYSWIANGIVWAADNGADIINMSLSGSSASSTWESAVNYAWNRGVLIVAAAGNDGDSLPEYPAYYENCMAVAATDQLDKIPSWSNRGDWVDVAAPGNGIYSTLPEGTYGYKSGTSMAAPHVAGLAALVCAVVKDINGDGRLNDEVRARIEATCDDIGITGIGSGRINAYKAVSGGDTPPPTTGSVAGKVTDAADGSPIAGATVTCSMSSVVTNSNGEFTITDLAEGTYTITASAAGYREASQSVSVNAGETSVANFALDKLAPLPPKDMWVESVTFRMTGRNLRLNIKVVSENGAVSGAQVAVQLTNGVQNWNFTGATDSTGLVTFVVNKAPAGNYVASVTDVTAAGYAWDTTQGVTSATYTVKKWS